MKVLFVSSTLPPEGTAAAGIIGNIMLKMKNKGMEISGLTYKSSMSDEYMFNWNSINFFHADFVREYGFTCLSLCDYYFRVKRKLFDLIHQKEEPRPYRRLAVDALINGLKKMNAASEYDYIIAVAAFYDSVEAVFRYRQLAAGKAKYVFYQLDPLQENQAFEAVDSDWIESYEMAVYSQADWVFTTREIYTIKQNKQWALENVTAVDFPCVDMQLSMRASSLKKAENEIRFVYAGQLNERIRDATATLKILSEIKNPHITFYFFGLGQEELLRKYSEGSLAGRLHIMGNISQEKCEDWILSADVLLIIGNSVANQVPSKVFSCMSYGLPVIATCKLQECPSRRYLQEIPNALIVEEINEDIARTAAWVEAFIMEHAGTRLTRELIEPYARKYTSEYIVDMFLSVFEALKKAPEGGFTAASGTA